VSILIFLIVMYLLTSFMLMKPFEKAGIESWKALVPGLNFMEWSKLVGRKPSYALWMLFPIVNIFIWCALCVDLVRSFGRYSFLDSVLAVFLPPLIFWQIGNRADDKYLGGVVPKEQAYHEEVKQALAKKDKYALNKLATSPYAKAGWREWVEAIFFAVFAAAFIRMFIFEMYVIPTSSMEGSLLIGDYLAVGKFNYGLRTPMTVVQVPLVHNQIPVLGTESYINPPSLPYFRFPALSKIKNNDPFVFNWPIGDSVVMTPDRSFAMSQLQTMARTQGVPLMPDIEKNLIVRPIDKKDHYIKRCVGLPGDKFEIKDRVIHINGQAMKQPENVQFWHRINGNVNMDRLIEWGVNTKEQVRSTGTSQIFAMTPSQVEKVKGLGINVELVPRTEITPELFPFDTAHFKWSMDNYGPMVIPAAGASVNLSLDNLALYQRIIGVYERNKLEVKNGEIFINNSKATTYTFKQNYYWAQGDNRHSSEDSRYWGFVPEDHIVGKPLFIWMSIGTNGIRWNRIFTTANKD
jgi:signal peptidase I